MGSESMEIIEVNSFNEIPKNFTGMVKYYHGTQYWYLNGLTHREDGPAIIYPSGTQKWYQNGLTHREDGPAVIWHDGTQEWYLNGVRVTPMDLFEKLSDEQKEKVLWDLNQWK